MQLDMLLPDVLDGEGHPALQLAARRPTHELEDEERPLFAGQVRRVPRLLKPRRGAAMADGRAGAHLTNQGHEAGALARSSAARLGAVRPARRQFLAAPPLELLERSHARGNAATRRRRLRGGGGAPRALPRGLLLCGLVHEGDAHVQVLGSALREVDLRSGEIDPRDLEEMDLAVGGGRRRRRQGREGTHRRRQAATHCEPAGRSDSRRGRGRGGATLLGLSHEHRKRLSGAGECGAVRFAQ